MLRYISMELDHGQLQLSLSYACRFDRYYSLPVPVKILLSNCMALPQSNEKQLKFRFTKREVYHETISESTCRVFILLFVLPKYCD